MTEINKYSLDQPENEEEVTRTLLDQLLSDSRLFKRSPDYKALLDFTIRMRNFAPFNAMLLQIQKPGLRYAASRRDWFERFERIVNPDARPLLILWPFGPVALVYDLLDTYGKELPKHVYAFPAKGKMTEGKMLNFTSLIFKKGLETKFIDLGDNKAGKIEEVHRTKNKKEWPHYIIKINQNHNPNTKFATLVHELAHLYLGHFGADVKLKISDRRMLNDDQSELEAESASYLVCSRQGVENSSESYLSKYVNHNPTVDQIDIYQIMRAAGQIETILGLKGHTRFE